MNKKLIAVAVAGILAAPLASAAPTVYGIAHATFDKVSNDTIAGDTAVDNYQVNSRASRLGLKGSEDLGGGLKAVYKMEFGVNIADAGGLSSRNQYVGLSGGFGTLVIGRHDTPMKMSTGRLDFFGDEVGDYNKIAGFVDMRANNAVAYLTPKMGAFGAALAIVPGEEPGANADNDGIADAISANATYTAGPMFFAVAYETLGNMTGVTVGDDDWKATRFGAGYKISNHNLAFVYEKQDAGSDGVGDRGIMQLSWKMDMGSNAIKATYAKAAEWSEADDTDHTGYAIGFDHNFSKTSKVYVQYAAIQAGDAGYAKVNPHAADKFLQGGDETSLSFGMKTKF